MIPALVAVTLAFASSAGRFPEPATHDLARDEARGGHTLSRHVGRSDAELRERLRRERHIAAASTYTDRATAEAVVTATLDRAARRVEAWRRRRGPRPNLVLDYRGDRVIGRALLRGRRAPRPCTAALVVLRWDEAAGDDYVLTSYPEVRP